MRDILAETLEGWQPPQLVVIGAEKSGKSTLLERLLMIPIFPTAEEFCTRVPIHIRLRNSTEAKAPEIEVFNLTTSQTEEGPRMVSYQSGSVEVKEMMDRILGGCNKRISSDHVIIVHMQGPHIPSIDLVDMPGLTTTNELREQTANLIERHIQLHKDSSIYLMVVPATCPPNTSSVVQLVQSHHLESRTIGVFTMCDDVVQRKISSLAAHLPNPTDSCHGGVALEPHGWYATMNAPIDVIDGSNLSRLLSQAREEADFFAERMPGEGWPSGRSTCSALLWGIAEMFRGHVRATWLPETLKRLSAARDLALREDAALGLPAFSGRSREEVSAARQAVAAAASARVVSGFPAAAQGCYKDVLDPLKHRLLGLLSPDVDRLPLEAAVERLAAEEEAAVAACAEAAEAWGEYWKQRLPGLLELEEAVGEASGHSGEAGRPAPFRIRRFPVYLKEAGARVAAAADAAQLAAASASARSVRRYFGAETPWMQVSTELDGETALARVLQEGPPLAELSHANPLRPCAHARARTPPVCIHAARSSGRRAWAKTQEAGRDSAGRSSAASRW